MDFEVLVQVLREFHLKSGWLLEELSKECRRDLDEIPKRTRITLHFDLAF
jgi:hypothetical protein